MRRYSIVDDPKYRAIFRRHKGFYNSRPWDRYENEVLIVARRSLISCFRVLMAPRRAREAASR